MKQYDKLGKLKQVPILSAYKYDTCCLVAEDETKEECVGQSTASEGTMNQWRQGI